MGGPETRRKWPPEDDQRGLVCRRCGCHDLPVDHTRKASRMIIRYRHCRNCGRRVTTCERIAGAG